MAGLGWLNPETSFFFFSFSFFLGDGDIKDFKPLAIGSRVLHNIGRTILSVIESGGEKFKSLI